jgi:large subunit ribosomal protein L17
MRHNISGYKLGRTSGARVAMRRNLMRQLLTHDRISRRVASRLGSGEVLKRLFEEVAPRFSSRNGGYTRVVKLGPRLGDSAEMVILELVEE